MSRIVCQNCSAQYDDGRPICPFCAHDRNAPIQGFTPSVIIAGPDQQTGEHVVKVADPSVSSETRMNDDGVISLYVRGATGIGRPGEGRVALVLQEKLVASGHKVEVTSGDDPKGVDRIMVVDGETFILQVTVAPQASDFWRDASQSSGTTQVSQPHAASWLREAIETKSQAPVLQDAPVLLALDVRHAGVVAMGALVQEYLSRYGSPTREFGFASVWIVGPVPQYCSRLGDGRP